MAGKTTREKELHSVLKFIKNQRERVGLTQQEVADALDYPTGNFICMLEKGKSKIPSSKIPELVRVLRLPSEFEAVLFKELYPDTWRVFRNAARKFPEFFDDPDISIGEALDKSWKKSRGL